MALLGVTDFNLRIENAINGERKPLWMKGIIQGYHHPKPYFQLEVEKQPIKCFVPKPFRESLIPFLRNDMLVKVRAILGVYADEAQLQLSVQDIQPLYTLNVEPLPVPADLHASIEKWLSTRAPMTIRGQVERYVAQREFHYFNLTDTNTSIRCLIYQEEQQQLSFPIAEGLEIGVKGNLEFYKRHSRFQLRVQQAQHFTIPSEQSTPKRTNGSVSAPPSERTLPAQYLQPIHQLAQKGLWPKRQSYPLPKTIKQIGLVTSQQSQALQDFQGNYARTSGKATLRALFASVKGQQAASEIAMAINRFNQEKQVDVIVVTRGGGDKAELAIVFDSAVIAEAICHSSIPVITAIGHSSDHSFTDEVADVKYSTPTEAAIRLAEIPIKRRLFA